MILVSRRGPAEVEDYICLCCPSVKPGGQCCSVIADMTKVYRHMVPAPSHCQKHRPIGVIDAADFRRAPPASRRSRHGWTATQRAADGKPKPLWRNGRTQRQIWRRRRCPAGNATSPAITSSPALRGICSHLDRTVEGYAGGHRLAVSSPEPTRVTLRKNCSGQDADRHSLGQGLKMAHRRRTGSISGSVWSSLAVAHEQNRIHRRELAAGDWSDVQLHGAPKRGRAHQRRRVPGYPQQETGLPVAGERSIHRGPIDARRQGETIVLQAWWRNGGGVIDISKPNEKTRPRRRFFRVLDSPTIVEGQCQSREKSHWARTSLPAC